MTAICDADPDCSRKVVRITGADRHSFLQGLVTNDVSEGRHGLVYAALLSPQGKYLADFFVQSQDAEILLDVDARLVDDLVKRLSLYKLRADVQIALTDLQVLRGLTAPPAGAHPDPRSLVMGWRWIAPAGAAHGTAGIDWDALHVDNKIPQSLTDLKPNESYILEMDFERLSGVDFKKGCYVGQEVTARMKHKTQLRKGLGRVTLSDPVATGTPILRDGKEVGALGTVAGERALAYLRYDRMGPGAVAGDASVSFEI